MAAKLETHLCSPRSDRWVAANGETTCLTWMCCSNFGSTARAHGGLGPSAAAAAPEQKRLKNELGCASSLLCILVSNLTLIFASAMAARPPTRARLFLEKTLSALQAGQAVPARPAELFPVRMGKKGVCQRLPPSALLSCDSDQPYARFLYESYICL